MRHERDEGVVTKHPNETERQQPIVSKVVQTRHRVRRTFGIISHSILARLTREEVENEGSS